MSKRKGKSILLILGILAPPCLILAAAWWWGNIQKEHNSQFNTYIAEASYKYNVDPLLIRSVIWRESDYEPDAVGLAQERGLMQVTPVAGQEWAEAEHIENFRPVDLFDPRTNIHAGTWYLGRALGRWEHTDKPIAFALAEYNAGRSHARRWAADLPEAQAALFIDQIDFPTTKKYILDILDRYHYYKEHPDPPVWTIIWSKVSGYYWRWMESRRIKAIKEQNQSTAS